MILNLLEILIFGFLILLSFLLFTNPLKVNIKANAWFAAFLLLWSSFWLDEIVYLTTHRTVKVNSYVFVSVIQFLTPIFYFISVQYFTNPKYKFDQKWLLYLIAPALYLMLLYFKPLPEQGLKIVFTLTILSHALYYSIASVFLIRKHKKRIQFFESNIHEIDLGWLEAIIVALLALTVLVAFFNLIFFDAPLNLFMNGFTFLVVLFTAYHSLKQKAIVVLDSKDYEVEVITDENNQSETPNKKILSEERLIELKAQLSEVMLKDEPYLDCNLNLVDLAEKLNISSHQLSYLINKGFNQNFYGLVNSFRVKKAKKLLTDVTADKYSIIGIAYESGFNSKTSFNNTFKKLTGLTPSEYKQKSSDL